MRLLFYKPVLRVELGGPVRATLDLASGLSRRGHEVGISCFDAGDFPDPWRNAEPGHPSLQLLSRPKMPGGLFSPAQLDVARSILTGFDRVHIQNMWSPSSAQIAAVARSLAIPYIVSTRGMLDDWSMSQRRTKKRFYLWIAGRRMLEQAAFVHCTATSELEQAQKWFPRGRGTVIPNLLDLEPFANLPGPERARQAFNISPDGPPVLLFLSRIHQKKGTEVLVRAAAILRDRGVPFRVIIAGRGTAAYERSLADLVASLRLGERVSFIGQVSGLDKISLYQSARLFALPTSQENFGFVFFESLAAGLPVLTTPLVDTTRQLLASGGSFIADQTPVAFADTIERLLADPAALSRAGAAGREWTFRLLNPDVILGQYERMYTAAGNPTEHALAPDPFTLLGLTGSSSSVSLAGGPGLTKVLHYVPSVRLAEGGVPRAVLDLCGAVHSSATPVTLVTADPTDVPSEWRADNPRYPAVVVVEKPTLPLGFYSQSALRRIEPVFKGADVVHLHIVWQPSNPQIAQILRRHKIPFVLSAHGMLDDWSMKQRPLRKRIFLAAFASSYLSKARFVHATADAERDQIRRYLPSTPAAVVPCVVDLSEYKALPGPEIARTTYGITDDGTPTVLFLSRIHVKKGIEVLLDAVALLAGKGTTVNLLIAGPGEESYIAQLRSRAESLSIAPRTRFLGMVSGVQKISLYQACDVFALPTSQENFGIVLIESLAAQTPVITTKAVDIWQELERSGAATIADRSAPAFAEAIRRIAQDRHASRRAGEHARRWVLETLDSPTIAARMADVYRTAASRDHA